MSNYRKKSNGWQQRFALKKKNEKKIYWVEQDCWITLTLSAAGLRTINKMGLDAAIKQAAGNGYLTEIKMLY